MTKEKSHYVVAAEGSDYSVEHIHTHTRKEAVQEYIDMHSLEYEDMSFQIGVALFSDVAMFDCELTQKLDVRQRIK